MPAWKMQILQSVVQRQTYISAFTYTNSFNFAANKIFSQYLSIFLANIQPVLMKPISKMLIPMLIPIWPVKISSLLIPIHLYWSWYWPNILANLYGSNPTVLTVLSSVQDTITYLTLTDTQLELLNYMSNISMNSRDSSVWKEQRCLIAQAKYFRYILRTQN